MKNWLDLKKRNYNLNYRQNMSQINLVGDKTDSKNVLYMRSELKCKPLENTV